MEERPVPTQNAEFLLGRNSSLHETAHMDSILCNTELTYIPEVTN